VLSLRRRFSGVRGPLAWVVRSLGWSARMGNTLVVNIT
jgi:hypothetical protein